MQPLDDGAYPTCTITSVILETKNIAGRKKHAQKNTVVRSSYNNYAEMICGESKI